MIGRDLLIGPADQEIDVARVKMIAPEAAQGEAKRVYDHVLEQWGRISNFSKVLAHQPATLEGWALANDAIRLANVKTDPDYVKVQQLVIIKTSSLNRSAYCLSHNVPLGKKMGLTEAQIAAARGDDYMASPLFDDRQKAAIRWAEVVTNMAARDDEAAFAAMKKHFSEQQIVELTVFCGMWNYSNRLCEALHVDLERPDQRITFQDDE
jgi:alkylhydroperoxidase family enzyme